MLLAKELNHCRRAAFTLMEVLVVVAILVILAGGVTVAVFAYLDDAKDGRAQADIQILEDAVKQFKLKQGEFPQSLNEVARYVEGGQIPNSPWGTPYQYDPGQMVSPNVPYIYCQDDENQVHSNRPGENQ